MQIEITTDEFLSLEIQLSKRIGDCARAASAYLPAAMGYYYLAEQKLAEELLRKLRTAKDQDNR